MLYQYTPISMYAKVNCTVSAQGPLQLGDDRRTSGWTCKADQQLIPLHASLSALSLSLFLILFFFLSLFLSFFLWFLFAFLISEANHPCVDAHLSSLPPADAFLSSVAFYYNYFYYYGFSPPSLSFFLFTCLSLLLLPWLIMFCSFVLYSMYRHVLGEWWVTVVAPLPGLVRPGAGS